MDWLKGVSDRLPDLPSLSKVAEINVYLIHRSADPEDYFFLFDFEEFADRSKAGLFVRPAIRIFAGRDDFSRVTFARQFREVFAAEFDRMRVELGANKGKRGWLNFNFGLSAVDLIGNFVANIVLAIAFSAGKALLGRLAMPGLLKGKTAEAKLADEIEATKGQVEAALQQIELTLHPELNAHARSVGGTRAAGVDREAWPLPDYVRAHLQDGRNGSWW